MYFTCCLLHNYHPWLPFELHTTADPDLESNLGPVESRPMTTDDVLGREITRGVASTDGH